MSESNEFAADVLRIVCDRLAGKAADLRLMAETSVSFEDWLIWEAFLACKLRQPNYPFCEVAARPAYGSEGVADNSQPEPGLGGLRVGATNDADDHRWLFAEFALLHDGNQSGDNWRRQFEEHAAKLLRLRWRRSASLLIVMTVHPGDVPPGWGNDVLSWNRPALTDPFVLPLPGVGLFVVTAFDIKQDPAHTLVVPSRGSTET